MPSVLFRSDFLPRLFAVLLLFLPGTAAGAVLGEWYGATVRLEGDFIGGYFHDEALGGSAGRETQAFKMSRGILGLDIQHASGWGGLLEYNVFPDDVRRKESDQRTNFDWYNNLGTDLLYFGEFNVRNGYLRWLSPAQRWQVRAGRMINIIGFEESEVPFWGRLDSPHAHFLTKEIQSGLALAFDVPWLRIEVAGLGGRGRPDGDYNWYLNGASDPNIDDNSSITAEGEVTLRWREFFALSAGYRAGKTGSAPGGIFSGKHNDDRFVAGLRLSTPPWGRAKLRLHALGQFSHFKVGLTEDGQQGAVTKRESCNLDKDGWFAGAGVSLYDRARLFVTYEELDRVDSLVWAEVAQFDRRHPSLDSIERSLIIQADFALSSWVSLYAFYRSLDADFGGISKIGKKVVENGDFDKYGLVLKVKF